MPVLLADELMSPPPNKELIFPNYNYTLEKMPFMQQLSQRMKLFSSHQNIFKDKKKMESSFRHPQNGATSNKVDRKIRGDKAMKKGG